MAENGSPGTNTFSLSVSDQTVVADATGQQIAMPMMMGEVASTGKGADEDYDINCGQDDMDDVEEGENKKSPKKRPRPKQKLNR